MIPSLQKQLFQYIDTHLLSYLNGWENLATFLRQNADTEKIAARITELLQRRRVITRTLATESPFISGELRTGTPRTLLLYHYYNPKFHNLQYFASIITCLAALEAYQSLIGTLPINILWLLDGTGEADHSSIHDLVTRQPQQLQADGCLLYGNYSIGQTNRSIPLLSLGTKGLLCVELEAVTAPQSLPSMYGAVAPNALWRLLWALNTLKSAHEEILIEGFYDSLAPIEDEAVDQLRQLPNSTSFLAQQYNIDQPLLGLQGFQLHYAQLLSPTCSINELHNITLPPTANPLTIPGQARARLDFHLVPGQDPDDILAKLQRHLHAHGFDGVKARKLSASYPLYTSIADPFVQKAIYATTVAYEHAPVILPLTANSYPVYPLQQVLHLPVVMALPEYLQPGDYTADIRYKENFAASIKQVAMIIGELAYGIDPVG